MYPVIVRFVLVLAWLPVAGAADKVYKWVDEQGKVQYSSQPPRTGAVKAERVPVAPPPSPEDVRRAEEQTEQIKQRAAELEQERMAREAERAAREPVAEPAPAAGPVLVPGAAVGGESLPPGELRPGELPPAGTVVEPLPPVVPIPR